MHKIYKAMRKFLSFIAISMSVFIYVNALNNNVENALKHLDEVLASRPTIENSKRARIDSLTHAAALSLHAYHEYKLLYEEYRSYNYDTALIYTDFMALEASPDQLAEVDLCRAFVFLSGGLFAEAADILKAWPVTHKSAISKDTSSSMLLAYYITYTRLQWDMADVAGGTVGDKYNKEGLRLNNEGLRILSPRDTAQYWYWQAMADLKGGKDYTRSIERCKMSLSATQPSIHDQAVTASTLAYLYRLTGDIENSMLYFIEAAICDIKSSTYETVAMRNLAELLFEAGETDLADRYIHHAMLDAERYHARHRQIDIAHSLPIIEGQLLSRSRVQQRIALILLAIVAILLAFGIISIVILRRNLRALRSAQQMIDGMNRNLLEANKLKEELLGTLLSSRSQYINAVQHYQQSVKQNAVNRQWSELLTVPKSADARLQRTVLDRQIDTVFLSVYPTFVRDFNMLLKPSERIVLKNDELLNAQLRIFALIRMGVNHNEVIAEILDYSINTVYNYKTRVIASSSLSQEEFYQALMQIPSFSN